MTWKLPGVRRSALFLSLFLFSACGPAPDTGGEAASGSEPPTVALATSDRAAVADSGMVVSAHILASQVGDEILRRGGNAVDAAVATGFALAVLVPRAGNIGGGGFMVIRFPDGQATALDFREKAPLAAHPEMWLDENGEYDRNLHHNSHRAVGVPGTVAGFAYAHAKYGSLPWAELVEPAIALAEEGFDVTPAFAASLRSFLRRARQHPATLAAFFDDGEPYAIGERFRQPDLAATLGRIRDQGAAGFYSGETARLIVAEMERGGGLITQEDLDRYQPVEREPVTGSYHDIGVIGMPPPSSGGVALVEMLNILEGYDLEAMGHNSADYLHHLIEAMRRAYRDRARFLADADFVDVPVDRLTSKAYAAQRRATIQDDTATPSSVEDTALTTLDTESPETTHYSVVDGSGMAVATTYTLESSYGSAITVPGAGFLLNNEMGDFNPGPGLTTERGLIGTEANLAQPEKRMLSSMTPIILTTPDDQLLAVLGSPGGRTIINTVLQVALNLVTFDMGIFDAVQAPRIHHQWLPDEVEMEDADWGAATLDGLRDRGHSLVVEGSQGRANSIQVGSDGRRYGAPDPRYGDAGAAGH